jgi:hypothetical protein
VCERVGEWVSDFQVSPLLYTHAPSSPYSSSCTAPSTPSRADSAPPCPHGQQVVAWARVFPEDDDDVEAFERELYTTINPGLVPVGCWGASVSQVTDLFHKLAPSPLPLSGEPTNRT